MSSPETTATREADITAKTLLVTGITRKTRFTTERPTPRSTWKPPRLDGVVDGDDVVLVTTEAAGAFADAGEVKASR